MAHIKGTKRKEGKGQSCSSLTVDITIIPLFLKKNLESNQEAGRLIIISEMPECVCACVRMCVEVVRLCESQLPQHIFLDILSHTVYTVLNCKCVCVFSHCPPQTFFTFYI